MNDYKNRGLKFLIAGVLLIVVGITCLVITKNPVFCALNGAGSVWIVTFFQRRMKTEKEYNRLKNSNDERSKMISNKAGCITFYIIYCLILVGLGVATAVDNMFCAYILCALLIVGVVAYCLSYGILNRKM